MENREYNNRFRRLLLQEFKMGLAKRIKKQIDDFDLKPENIGFNKTLIINKIN